MAEFIIGSPLRKLARKHEPLRQFLWRLDYGFLWLLEKCLMALPVDLSSRIGGRIGAFFGPMMKNKTAIFRNNFALAFPELNDDELNRLVLAAWGRAGRVLAEYPHLAALQQEPHRLQIEIRTPINTYADPSNACVMVTAHQSNWELGPCALAKMGIPNASIYSPPTNPMLDRLLLDSRRALNNELIPRKNSARLLMRALKAGRTATMVMDRRVDQGKPVEFFGQNKLSTLLPAKLALKFDRPLVPVQVVRLKDATFKVIFHPPVVPACPQGDENTQALDMIQQVHALFEQWILEKPEDWFCSKRLWQKGKIATRASDTTAEGDSYAS